MGMNNKANLIYLSWDKASKVDKPKRKINQPILNLTDLIINLEFGSNSDILRKLYNIKEEKVEISELEVSEAVEMDEVDEIFEESEPWIPDSTNNPEILQIIEEKVQILNDLSANKNNLTKNEIIDVIETSVVKDMDGVIKTLLSSDDANEKKS